MIKMKLAVAYFFVIITVVSLGLALELFYFRRNRLVKSISTLVGEHLVELRASKNVGGPMPIHMMTSAMNERISETDEEEAKKSMELMMGLVTEAKRREFRLPMVQKDIALIVKKWAERGVGKTSALAAKLLTHIVKGHAEHVDQVVSQSHVQISNIDGDTAAQQMRFLNNHLDGAIAAGLSIDPKIVLFQPNVKTVDSWVSSDHLKAKLSAESLLKTLSEAKDMFMNLKD